MKRPVRKSFDADVLPQLLKVLRAQIRVLEGTVDALEQGQSLVPPPMSKEIGEMRYGKRPLTREAFLLGACQRLIMGAESLISDLRTVTHKTTLERVHALDLEDVDFNAIQAAVEHLLARHQKGKA